MPVNAAIEMKSLTVYCSQLIAKIPPDIVLLIIVSWILYFFFYKGFPKLKKVKSFGRRLDKRTELIKSDTGIHFDEISDELPELKGLIDEFKELLTNEGANSQNCETVLSEENVFRAIDVDEAVLEHYPGFFTALGIVGTFIGILYALTPIADTAINKVNLDHLLKGAGVAFLTSIIGIISSLTFLSFERKIIGRFKQQLFNFQSAINAKLIRITTESLLVDVKKQLESLSEQSDVKTELREIKDALETMADDIGTAVSKTISETLANISTALETSVVAAGNSSEVIVSKVMGSIDGTLDKFSENLERLDSASSLQADVVEQFDKSVNNTKELVSQLEVILPSMTNIASDLKESSERLEKLPDALIGLVELQEEFTTVVKDSIKLMTENWQTERKRLTDLVEELKQQFTSFEEGIANGLQTTMSKFDDELSRAGTYIATWLERLNEDVTGFSSQIEAFEGSVQNSASSMQDVMSNFSKTLSSHSSELEAQFANIGTSLSTEIGKISGEISQLPPELKKSISGIEDIYKEVSTQLPQVLSGQIQNIADEISKLPPELNNAISGIQKIYKDELERLPILLNEQNMKMLNEIKKASSRKGLASLFRK